MSQTFTGRKNIQIGLALGTFAVAAVLSSLHNQTHVQANATPQAFPPVVTSPTGDPRLEPVPTGALQLSDFNVFGDGNVMTMRFPPRVNGQSFSAGDRHADLYVLFDAATGLPVPNAPFILEAIPKNGAGPNVTVDDFTARVFSSIWELHAVTIDTSGYDPSNPAVRIDSELKVFTSPRVKNVYQTNIFLNCPVVPSGSTMSGGPNRMHSAFWNGNAVQLATFEIEDGGFNPQVLFRFEDPSGNVCGGATNPYLVASHAPGDPFYSTIWELWSVHVPNCNINFRSRNDFKNNGYRVTSTNIRLNCPVTHVGDTTFPVEDAVSLLTDSSGRFDPQAFPKDSPGTFLTKQRTFVITEVVPGGSGLPLTPVDAAAQATGFPAIKPDTTGNVIPLLLVDPFQTISSGPNSAGPRIRFNQTDLDAAYPSLPPAIENNFNLLINKGLLDPVWGANGGKSYQQRLALIGRALFEMVFTPEQGANSKDVTSCYSCHSLPSAGGAARGLYTLTASNPQRPDLGFITQLNAGSMWGSGGSELLNLQKHDRGERVTPGAHGSRGNIPSMRGVVGGGNNAHLGMQATEVFGFGDSDGDGVSEEMTAGEVTAETVYLMTLPVPDQNVSSALQAMGVTDQSVQNGRSLFRRSLANGGPGCAGCHVPFQPLMATAQHQATTFLLKNPETPTVLSLQVPHHTADASDVADGYATSVGQPGLRLYGDMKRHKMGGHMFSNGGDVVKTAETWDAGSVFPYLRDGSQGSSLMGAILAHEGVSLDKAVGPSDEGGKWGGDRSGDDDPGHSDNENTDNSGNGGGGQPNGNGIGNVSIVVTRGTQIDNAGISTQTITLKNKTDAPIGLPVSGSNASTSPLRIVLAGNLTAGVTAAAGAQPDAVTGSLRQGAFWQIASANGNPIIPAGASITITLSFNNPSAAPLQYDLAIQDDIGYSEAAAVTRAFESLDANSQQDIVNFLRAQMIDGKIAEGSGR